MDQLSLFDIQNINSEIGKVEDPNQEKLLTKLPPSDYLYNSLVKIGDKVFYKQEVKRKQDINHYLYIPPSYSEICKECLKKGYISDLNEFNKCYLHGGRI